MVHQGLGLSCPDWARATPPRTPAHSLATERAASRSLVSQCCSVRTRRSRRRGRPELATYEDERAQLGAASRAAPWRPRVRRTSALTSPPGASAKRRRPACARWRRRGGRWARPEAAHQVPEGVSGLSHASNQVPPVTSRTHAMRTRQVRGRDSHRIQGKGHEVIKSCVTHCVSSLLTASLTDIGCGLVVSRTWPQSRCVTLERGCEQKDRRAAPRGKGGSPVFLLFRACRW